MLENPQNFSLEVRSRARASHTRYACKTQKIWCVRCDFCTNRTSRARIAHAIFTCPQENLVWLPPVVWMKSSSSFCLRLSAEVSFLFLTGSRKSVDTSCFFWSGRIFFQHYFYRMCSIMFCQYCLICCCLRLYFRGVYFASRLIWETHPSSCQKFRLLILRLFWLIPSRNCSLWLFTGWETTYETPRGSGNWIEGCNDNLSCDTKISVVTRKSQCCNENLSFIFEWHENLSFSIKLRCNWII